MRFFLLLLLVTSVAAHPTGPPGPYVEHTDWIERTLEPGQVNDTQLSFGGGVFQQGWFMLWHGQVEGSVEAQLLHDGVVTDAWTWNGSVAAETRIRETGLLTLRLHNAGPSNATVRVYYDQTCECSAKKVPGSGPVWFNVDAPKGDAVSMDFLVVAVKPLADVPRGNITITVEHAVAGGGATTWPDDFRILETQTIRMDNRSLYFPVQFESHGRDYIRLTIDHDGSPEWSFQIKPSWTTQPAPGLGVIGVAAALWLARPRRARRA